MLDNVPPYITEKELLRHHTSCRFALVSRKFKPDKLFVVS